LLEWIFLDLSKKQTKKQALTKKKGTKGVWDAPKIAAFYALT